MKCEFLSDEEQLHNHTVRLLQIECPNGFKGQIYVTKEPPFSIQLSDNTLNTWHYELSENNTRITLTGPGSNSVAFKKPDGSDYCHETITNWPVKNA